MLGPASPGSSRRSPIRCTPFQGCVRYQVGAMCAERRRRWRRWRRWASVSSRNYFSAVIEGSSRLSPLSCCLLPSLAAAVAVAAAAAAVVAAAAAAVAADRQGTLTTTCVTMAVKQCSVDASSCRRQRGEPDSAWIVACTRRLSHMRAGRHSVSLMLTRGAKVGQGTHIKKIALVHALPRRGR